MIKVAIIGGGIAGLATAYFLQKSGRGKVEYKLIEQSATFGGKITSSREKGFVIEGGPDSFLTTKPAAIDLARELGLGDQLIGTNDEARKVYVWSRGKLRAMPEGVMLIIPTRVMPFVRSPLISWRGKLRMGMDLFIPPRRDNGDESLAHFVRRRLGEEALDRIAEPMIAGIYVADAEYLSLKSTFPRFLDMEAKYGGLLRSVVASKRSSSKAPATKPRTSMFMTLRGGLGDLVQAITQRLEPNSLIAGRQVMQAIPQTSGFELALDDGSLLHADQLVFASPSYATTDLVQGFDQHLAERLRVIRYVSTATVSFGYKRSELNHSLSGFGFVVPRSEKRKIIACSWSSTKFNYRAADGFALVRAFVGGAHEEKLAESDDATLAGIAREEMYAMMGITAKPVLTQVYSWHKANPQYAVGHQARVKEIEDCIAQHDGIYLVGSAYHGVGIPDCIEDGKHVAEQILAVTGE